MRGLRICIGMIVAAAGALGIACGALVFFRRADLLALTIVGLGLGGVVVAVASFVWWPYRVRWSQDDCLVLQFLFRTELVSSSDIVWYKKDGVTWRLTSTDNQADADVFVILRYRRQGRVRPSIAFFSLDGTGPAFSTRGREYDTLLDQHIPEKLRHRL